ncbi:MAG: hypothetical protein K8R87_08400 [Verrucomicrobia bacterium]|nr:hypothetical protein [Verrucomicrobiota bacterium]
MLYRRFTLGLTFLLLVIVISIVRAQSTTSSGVRTWTNAEGKTMQAKLTGINGDNAIFQLASGQTTTVPLAKLSPADQNFIKSNPVPDPSITSKTSGTAKSITQRVWPKDIIVSPKSIDVKLVEEKPAENYYRYHSEAFEFISQDKLAGSVMIEVARIFEGTRTLVDALPWGVHPEPPKDLGYFQAKFFTTEEAYHKNGGPEKSGGVYKSADRVFLVPFKSMGLELRGKTWFKKAEFSSDTLVHEITHQMMHDYLGFLPHWITEGCAEYTNMLPYNAGTFHAGSHAKGIKEYISHKLYFATGGLSDLGSASEHMNMTPESWTAKFNGGHEAQHRIYGYSCLLVYYFCHLDGDGKGTRFLKFFDALTAETDKWKNYNEQLASYKAELEEFFKQPGVKKLENGSFTYPKTLTPPQRPEVPQKKDRKGFGQEQMALLYDGRTPTQLDEDVKTGFKKIGVKW